MRLTNNSVQFQGETYIWSGTMWLTQNYIKAPLSVAIKLEEKYPFCRTCKDDFSKEAIKKRKKLNNEWRKISKPDIPKGDDVYTKMRRLPGDRYRK